MEIKERELWVEELTLLRPVIHDGRPVEIQKFKRIRMSGIKAVDAVESGNGF